MRPSNCKCCNQYRRQLGLSGRGELAEEDDQLPHCSHSQCHGACKIKNQRRLLSFTGALPPAADLHAPVAAERHCLIPPQHSAHIVLDIHQEPPNSAAPRGLEPARSHCQSRPGATAQHGLSFPSPHLRCRLRRQRQHAPRRRCTGRLGD